MAVPRILPLAPLLLWLTWSNRDIDAAPAVVTLGDWLALLWMIGGQLAIVAIMTVWARLLLVTHRDSFAPLPTRAFHYALLAARIATIVWFGVALYSFDFGLLIAKLLQPLEARGLRLPSIVAATAPALVSWFGLAWAAYPIDRATREQNLLAEIDAGMTPRAPPTLAQSLSTNFRLQVLFLLAPVFAVAALRDAVALFYITAGVPLEGRAEAIAFVASSLLVFIASPELLVAVLRARPLADSPLRRRLEALANGLNLRYRNILVWHTSYGIGNAAVMGLVPRFRYILLTDLLIETLDDRQIEAVFAHEAGHVKHRHLLWYVAHWAMFFLCIAGPTDSISRTIGAEFGHQNAVNVFISVATLAAYLALFGVLSRLFERQADVFAARSLQSLHVPEGAAREFAFRPAPMATPVGSIGAESFVSALTRVAEISHRPIIRPSRSRSIFAATMARALDMTLNFTHPSIPDRIDHLRGLAMRPSLTTRFDRKVVLVMLGMLFVLMTLSTWVLVQQVR